MVRKTVLCGEDSKQRNNGSCTDHGDRSLAVRPRSYRSNLGLVCMQQQCHPTFELCDREPNGGAKLRELRGVDGDPARLFGVEPIGR